MLCSQSEAQHYARMLLSGYPNANPADPQYYLTNVIAVMVRYEHDVVYAGCQATGIPAAHPTFLPTAGEISNWLERKAAELTKADRYFGLIPAPDKSPPRHKWDLFVANTINGYDRIVEMTKDAPSDTYKFVTNYVNQKDGSIASGVWVPWKWWESVRGRV